MSNRRQQVILGAFLGILLLGCQLAYGQQPARRIGVGVAIGNIYDVFSAAAIRTTEDQVGAPAIFVPVQVMRGLRLEPEISVFRHSHEEPSDYSANSVEVGVGVFPQTLEQNFRLYYGVRIGYVRTEENEAVSLGITRTKIIDGFFIAPAVGGEYMLSERFGLGAEAQFRYTSLAGDDVTTSQRVPSRPPDVERSELFVAATRVLFVSRFYF